MGDPDLDAPLREAPSLTQDPPSMDPGEAALRNLAISLLRLAGFTNMAKGTRWAAWTPDRALGLMGL